MNTQQIEALVSAVRQAHAAVRTVNHGGMVDGLPANESLHEEHDRGLELLGMAEVTLRSALAALPDPLHA